MTPSSLLCLGRVAIATGVFLCLGTARAGGGAAADPVALPPPASFDAAVAAVAQATGAKPELIETRSGTIPAAEGRSFAIEPKLAKRLVDMNHGAFLKAGLYLFRYERSYGVAGEKDLIGILRTTDRNAVIRRMGTAGPKNHVTADQIIAWLDKMQKDQPFQLSEVGVDFVGGKFDKIPSDPVVVAQRSAELAPDLVAGNRDNMMRLLVEEIRKNGTLMLVWE